MAESVAVVTGAHCDGCLGSSKCWVCLGHGVLDKPDSTVDACHRCYGTGRCALCQSVRIRDLGAPVELTP